MRRVVGTVLVVLVLLVGAGLAIVLTGSYDVRATASHTWFVGWALETTRERAVAEAAAGVDVPDLDDPEMVEAGFRAYRDMCAGCHTPPGGDDSPVARGMNPAPPEMAHAAEELSDAELFWVTKHGLRMTGMPAWGVTHDDQSLWEIVAFVRRLPGMSPSDYRAFAERMSGERSQGDGGGSSANDSAHRHADGHAHEHQH